MQRLSRLQSALTESAPEPHVTETVEGQNADIGVLSMNSPNDLNALSAQMVQGLKNGLQRFQTDPKIKVICIRSTNPMAFCAGADIKGLGAHMSHATLLNMDNTFDVTPTQLMVRKPVICAVNGFTFGGGFELALNCDIIICSDDTVFALPEIKLGIFPGAGGTAIGRIIGKYFRRK